MGYYNASQIGGYWSLASEFLLCDHYFASVLGPTIPNRLYAIAGGSGGITENSLPASGLNLPSIFDQLTANDLGWNYYYAAGGTEAPLPLWLNPLRDEPTEVADVAPMSGLLPAINAGRLPAVTFVDPSAGPLSEQPPLSVTTGESWALTVIHAIESSPVWNSTVVFLTWDEGGGFYDHVVPPTMDTLGDGFRVPMLVISPFTLHGGISSSVFDHTSVLRFIDRNWGLPPLDSRVAAANDIGTVLTKPASSPSPSLPVPPGHPPSPSWLSADVRVAADAVRRGVGSKQPPL
jgi:phospholipase C